ncbi:Endonuclease/Exonuclease/phosphatase [Trichophyton interdigitale]|uniref:polynucleotide adenylyltransferase n=1 Tax=Trichophyton interdigitale TaxID=101480 RepID=A0A9P5CZ10_9EURO|nr:Endonuclease/Exonuclease/phosphatase [Trichophyton interdigitale]
MADQEESPETKSLSLLSFQTALCIVPPRHLWKDIDRLRSLYDQAYGRWPPHINLIYPFVPTDRLPDVSRLVQEKLNSLSQSSEYQDITVQSGPAGYFRNRGGNTIHLTLNDRAADQLRHLRASILDALGHHGKEERDYCPHLTIGQTKADVDLRDFLLDKTNMLPAAQWDLDHLVILHREKGFGGSSVRKMVIWDAIDLSGNTMSTSDELTRLYSGMSIHGLDAEVDASTEQMTTYEYSPGNRSWCPITEPPLESANVRSNNFTISTYNVLAEFTSSPPLDRYEALVRNILSSNAVADVLVLQEVCDNFLLFLLSHQDIQRRYPFVTHGPPGQGGSPPLPSLRNIVVFSQWRFTWAWLPFDERHKGAAVVKIDGIGDLKSSLPLVVVAVHLTSGLNDVAVDSKLSQINSIIHLLDNDYHSNPSVIAGDFNFVTSQEVIDEALKLKMISPTGLEKILGLNCLLSKAHFMDGWVVAGEEPEDAGIHTRVGEGEQGATFDPILNPLAAQYSVNGRPQRYDRIFVRQTGKTSATDFNFFGLRHALKEENLQISEFASDHWGIRAGVQIGDSLKESKVSESVSQETPLQLVSLPDTLSSLDEMVSSLEDSSMLPGEEDIVIRKTVVATLAQILTEPIHDASGRDIKTPLVLIPVGSYGLGTWGPRSDVDCLCIGAISSTTFFALAIQRLRKASALGIRIVRKVKAATGVMLELQSGHIKLDLQYCPAANIAERWQEVSRIPSHDPIFDLSLHSLSKLQPYRDQEYVKRMVPDMYVFRLAHRCITQWAKSSGVYSSKFGLLGGIHITMMLSRLHQLIHERFGRVTVPELVAMFFHHYAHFDWKNNMVVSPGVQTRYRRSLREPMVILTAHVPTVNVARAVTAPSLRTIVSAFKRAEELIGENGAKWSNILNDISISHNNQTGAEKFLAAYNSYIKVNVQYWGPSPTQASSLIGWLESRFFRLLNDLDRQVQGIHGRIWPARFTSIDAPDSENDGETEYQGCYLVELERMSDAVNTAANKEETLQTLNTAITRFTASLHEEDKYFNSTVCWIDATLVKQAELGELKLDLRNWGGQEGADQMVSDFSEDDNEADDPDDEHEARNALLEEGHPGRSKPHSKHASLSSKPVSTNKLRPAGDVISRLRWDPKIDFGDYLVGYEDRFLGVKEMPLSRWKSEQTDEEFIPQHRIVYFKRKSDGRRVWDRETRKDEIFGSGASGCD